MVNNITITINCTFAMLVLAPWVATAIYMVISFTTYSLIISPSIGITFSKRIELNVAFPLHSLIANPIFMAIQDIVSVTKATSRPFTATI